MTNYLNGKIYKIVCNETNLTYYGSTVQTLKKRLSQHKENKNIKKYTTNKMTNPEIYLIEEVNSFLPILQLVVTSSSQGLSIRPVLPI